MSKGTNCVCGIRLLSTCFVCLSICAKKRKRYYDKRVVALAPFWFAGPLSRQRPVVNRLSRRRLGLNR